MNQRLSNQLRQIVDITAHWGYMVKNHDTLIDLQVCTTFNLYILSKRIDMCRHKNDCRFDAIADSKYFCSNES